MSEDRGWSLVVVAFLCLLWVFGGATRSPYSLVGLILTGASLVVLAASLWRLRVAIITGSMRQGFALILAATLLVLVQLVPLPAGLWPGLAGREGLMHALSAAGIAPAWHALSLAPALTRETFLIVLPGFAMFMAATAVAPRHRAAVAMAVVGLALAAALWGLAQRQGGAGGTLYLYGQALRGSATGPFVNRNLQAAGLYVAIPLLFALVVGGLRAHLGRVVMWVLGGFLLIGVIIVGLGATTSRAGILLAMLAVVLSTLLSLRRTVDAKATPAAKVVGFASVMAAMLLLVFGLTGILRLAQTDFSTDYRAVMSAVSLATMKTYFPWGSGLGTFVPVYALHETPATMMGHFVIHAHNDWLELAIEGGVLAIALMAAFLLWYVAMTWRVWRQGGDGVEDVLARAASLSVLLLLLHSLGDFPLRMPYLMAVFALFLGFMAAGPRVHGHHHHRVAGAPASASPAVMEPSLAPPRQPRQGPFFKTSAGVAGPDETSSPPSRREPPEHGSA